MFVAFAVPDLPPAPAPRVWDVLAVLVTRTDVPVPGFDGPVRVRVGLDDADREVLGAELAAFATRVHRGTAGRLSVRVRIVSVPGPLATLTGPGPYWIGPGDVAPLLAGIPDAGTADTILAFAKIGEATGAAVPVRHLGGAVGGDRGPAGACFAGIGFRPGWIDKTGTVALHEFLHGLRWALVEVGGFPEEALPDPDEGRAGPGCCPDAPAGDAAFADHLLARHVTPRMCAAADAREGPAVPDGWLRGWSVDGAAPAGQWRTVVLPPGADAAEAPLPPGARVVVAQASAPMVLRVDDGEETMVREQARVPVRGTRIRITRALPGSEVSFRVRVEPAR